MCIVYFDHGCLGYWTAFWRPCLSHQGQLQFHLVDTLPTSQYPTTILHESEVCAARKGTSFATCLNAMLLNLYDMLLGKLITSGLIVPSLFLFAQQFPKRPSDILLRLELHLQLALLASGPLPLLGPLLCIATLNEALIAAVSRHMHIMKVRKQDHIERAPISAGPQMGENARFENGHARVETHVLKTLECRNGFWTCFKQ